MYKRQGVARRSVSCGRLRDEVVRRAWIQGCQHHTVAVGHRRLQRAQLPQRCRGAVRQLRVRGNVGGPGDGDARVVDPPVGDIADLRRGGAGRKGAEGGVDVYKRQPPETYSFGSTRGPSMRIPLKDNRQFCQPDSCGSSKTMPSDL